MSRIDRKYFYDFGSLLYDPADKESVVRDHIGYMLSRTQRMFKYTNLPDTIPERMLEYYLQSNGHVGIAEVNGSLYALTGGRGGEPDPYYMPTVYTVSNPALKLSMTYEIDGDCVVIPNDPFYIGLLPMFKRYATALCENELSMQLCSYNSRITSLLSASDDRTRSSAEQYIKNLIEGKPGIIAESAFLDGLKSQPYGSNSDNTIKNLIEFEQYLKGSWFSELGLESTFNMKREAINSAESNLNEDVLYPLIDSMLLMRSEGLEKVNKMFGTNISVELDSSWKNNQEELDAELEMMSAEVEQMAEEPEQEPEQEESEVPEDETE